MDVAERGERLLRLVYQVFSSLVEVYLQTSSRRVLKEGPQVKTYPKKPHGKLKKVQTLSMTPLNPVEVPFNSFLNMTVGFQTQQIGVEPSHPQCLPLLPPHRANVVLLILDVRSQT